jgi:molybdate transport system regulatory protein
MLRRGPSSPVSSLASMFPYRRCARSPAAPALGAARSVATDFFKLLRRSREKARVERSHPSMLMTSMTSAEGEQPALAAEKPVLAGRRLRHRVMVAGKYVFGPGKADLLSGIRETGSLAATARRLSMSYMRAWTLVQEMHRMYAKPLVQLRRGGKTKGGAALTPDGEKALLLYRQMEAEALAATEPAWKEFCALLKPAPGEGPTD